MSNANTRHQDSLTNTERFAVWITDSMGTMTCAGLFACIGIGSLIGIFTGNALLGLGVGGFSSYFLQLVSLPLIMISQNIQSRHAEHLADVTFEDAEEIKKLLKKLLSERGIM
jgi:hypothetical protein